MRELGLRKIALSKPNSVRPIIARHIRDKHDKIRRISL